MADYYPAPASTGFTEADMKRYSTHEEEPTPRPVDVPPDDNAGVWDGYEDPTGRRP